MCWSVVKEKETNMKMSVLFKNTEMAGEEWTEWDKNAFHFHVHQFASLGLAGISVPDDFSV
jgi:hypothetical protein